MPVCTDCGGTVIEYDAAAGNGFCVQCGTVVEDNMIVSEVTFGETGSGAAMVQGSFVAQGATHARMGGPFGNRSGGESREQTIANANKKIQQVSSALRLSEVVQLAATRLYTLALEHKFTKGRKSMNVVAVCLYVACRQKETRNYMLIDFSDLLQVNVFELGHTYLQLVQTLNLRLPLVDPSHYISRFAALLEFGDETHQVAMDAVRLVQRFDRDWMTRGRRPAGICGACLLLAARMNNFRRSIAEVVQVVKIADSTLKKRLDEFKKTPSGALTLADFRSVWLEDEMDPPAYTKGKEKEEKAREEMENDGPVQKKKKKKKRKRGEDEEEEEEIPPWERMERVSSTALPPPPVIDPALLNEGILVGTSRPSRTEPLFLPEEGEEPPINISDANIDPSLLDPAILTSQQPQSAPPSLPADPFSPTTSPSSTSIPSDLPPDKVPTVPLPTISELEETVDAAVAEEVGDFLANAQGMVLAEALEDAERRRQAQFEGDDELLGLDEEELDRFLLTEDEVKIKERVWVELNKEYLEAIAAKAEQLEREDGKEKKSRKRRKASNKPHDSSAPHGSTAAESVRNLIKKNPKYSKRINYDALKDLFTDEGASVPGFDDKDGDSMYVMDDKSDGEGMIIEESGGGVGMVKPSTRSEKSHVQQPADLTENVDDDAVVEDEGYEEGSDKGEDYIEWDGYEQEV